MAICRTPDLAAADREMAEAYMAAMARTGDRARLEQAQSWWRTRARDVCTDFNCLRAAYRDRTQQLNNL